MAEGSYKAVTRFKTGTKDDGFEYIERGDEVTQADLDADDDTWEEYKRDELVLPSDVFDDRFPEFEEGANQPPGTPSNLADTAGTDLEAPVPPEDEDDEEPADSEGNTTFNR